MTYEVTGQRFSQAVTRTSDAMSIRYNNLVYEMRQRGERVIALSLGEAFFDIPLFPIDELPLPDIYHYTHSRGILPLRERISRYYGERYGVRVDPETELLMTAGSKAAIYFAMLAVLDPGDEVIIQEPAWVSYPEQAHLVGARPVRIPYDVGLDHLADYVTDRTRLVILTNPNNPRGSVMTATELERVVRVATEYGFYVLADEAYSDFVVNDDFCSAARFDHDLEYVILVNSISKNFGISGWRLGYAIGNSKLIERMLTINQHVLTCPAAIVQHYVARYFDQILAITTPQVDATVDLRRRVAIELDRLGLDYLPGSATFYFFVSIAPSALSSEEFAQRLLHQHRVAVVPGVGYGESCDGFVRLSIGSEAFDDIVSALREMRQLIDETRQVQV